MGHLMAVKDRQSSTDNLFEPLKQTIELLKIYGQDMSEEIYHQLQVCIQCSVHYDSCITVYLYVLAMVDNG